MRKSEVERKLKKLEIDYNFNSELKKFEIKEKDSEKIVNEFSEEEIERIFSKLKSQIHISRDRDIKIESRDIENYHLKIIYHRMKDGSKEYRIFLSFKKDDKLKRIRLRNEKIDSISRDEAKMIEYFRKIQKKDFQEKIS